MRCPNCGAEVNDGAKFCPSCGSQVIPGKEYSDLSSEAYMTMDSSTSRANNNTPASIPPAEPISPSPEAKPSYAGDSASASSANKISRIATKAGPLVAVIAALVIAAFFFMRGAPSQTEAGELSNGVFRSDDGALELVVRGEEASLNNYLGDALAMRRRCHLGDEQITTSLIVEYVDGAISGAYKPKQSSNERTVGLIKASRDGDTLTLTLNDGTTTELELERYGLGDGAQEWATALDDFAVAKEQYIQE